MAEYLADSIARFVDEHPNEVIACVALYFTTYGSSVFINFETLSHSDSYVEKNQDDYSIGEDKAERFYKDPNGFQYAQKDEFVFAGLPDFYEVKWPVKFRGLNGKVKKVDSDDESVGRVLLEAFEPALKSFAAFGRLKRSDTFRMGFSIHNTDCEVFWLHPTVAT